MRTLLVLFFVVSVMSYTANPITVVKNTLKDINACNGKINLTLVKVWGGDDIEDENQFFKFPQDVKVSSDGYVYIADSANNRIQVFDSKGNYKMTIGRKGQGPGDLLEPLSIALDNKNNLWVCDAGNLRVQMFDPQGNSLHMFRFGNNKTTGIEVNQKNEILLYSFEKSFNSNSLVFIVNLEGKIIQTIGTNPNKGNSILDNESICYDLDSHDNVFISFYASPYYQKYSPKGESLLVVTYEIPFMEEAIYVNDSQKDIVSRKRKYKISSDIELDSEDRVYLVITRRPPKENEKFFIGSGGRRYPSKIQSENTDRYSLLVFNDSGKIIASKQLMIFCDKLYIHKDNLFIIDTYMAMKIYQYKISFQE